MKNSTETAMMNPFARRPLGAPLSRSDRAGIAALFAFLVIGAGMTLARSERVRHDAGTSHEAPAAPSNLPDIPRS
jgi:hypothetical protein